MDSVTTYQAAVSKDGGAQIIVVEKRELNEGEVFIKIMASPINPSDRAMVLGGYGVSGKYSFSERYFWISLRLVGILTDFGFYR